MVFKVMRFCPGVTLDACCQVSHGTLSRVLWVLLAVGKEVKTCLGEELAADVAFLRACAAVQPLPAVHLPDRYVPASLHLCMPACLHAGAPFAQSCS